MRILVADTFPDTAREQLAENGNDCQYEPDLTAAELPERLASPEAPELLIVRSTPVNDAVFENATDLRYVIRAGSGTNTIDVTSAEQHGVAVCNVPGRNAIAVAELTLALLLALDRAIPENVTELRNGTWNKKRYAKACGIAGRNVGVLGLGNIGLAFAERARALGAVIHTVAKPNRSADVEQRTAAIGVDFAPDLATLARRCDVLSLHLPANDATNGLLNRDVLEQLAPGAIVLNTARAELIDEQALIEVMDNKGVRAGIDVFADEPGSATGTIDSALARHPNTYGTHHIGASTEQAQQAIAAEVVRMTEAFRSGTVPHRVNSPISVPSLGSEGALLSSSASRGGT